MDPAPALATRKARPAAAYLEYLQLLDEVITGLFAAGLSLRVAAGLPADAVGPRTDAVLDELNGIIRQIRGAAFNAPGQAPLSVSGADQ